MSLCLTTNCESFKNHKRQMLLQAKQNNVKQSHHVNIQPTVIRTVSSRPANSQSKSMSNLSHEMVPTEAAMSDEKRQLQDLSLNDAEALQAFVAKRKWFEVKLIVRALRLKGCSMS